MEIVELRPSVHLIKPVFGQVYVWQDGSQLTMVDTGVPGSQGDLSAAFAELGYRRGDLRRVIITHGHEDHAGSAAAVRQWGDVEVLAHRDDVATIRGERARAHPTLTPAERPLFDQVTATMPVLPPCAVDTELIDGDTIDFGQGAHIIATPGHTDGGIAIWLPAHRVLFTGDIVANGSSGLLLGPFNTDRAQARESVVRLAQTPADVVGFGHGDPLVDDVGATAWRALGLRCQHGPDAVPDPLG
jgi:glyoxylase-like metal-dependent hydrolase (beta-lactamase superfamily II)